MKIKTRITSLWLALIILATFFIFPACGGEVEKSTVKVILEQGEHFQVIGDSVKEVEIGGDVAFDIQIDEGYYYVYNNSGAVYENNQIILKNVKMPQRIKLDIQGYVYIVQLQEAEGLQVFDGETYAQKTFSQEVSHGESAVFDVKIADGYEYYQNTVNSADGNHQAATYENGKLTVSNVCSNKEVFVQLRKAAVEQERVTVQLEENEAFTIQGANEQEVDSGSDVTFTITVKEGYQYVSNNCGAEYDAETGKVVFKDARADQVIRMVFGKMNTETSYYHNGIVERAVEGDALVLTAKANTNFLFGGWYYEEKEETILYSYANNIKLEGDALQYSDLQPYFYMEKSDKVITYHANGGSIYQSADTSITYVFNHNVYLYPAALGEWCFKTFYRDGYAPIEYNTKADGSGQAFSLGSRIFSDERYIDLYVIWAKESPADDFNYTYVEEGPKQVGIALTKYTGTDKNVVIPTYIEDLPVMEIGVNCFLNEEIESVVLTKNLKTIKTSAFSNCQRLQTVYMCDNVEDVKDESFSQCRELKNLRMVAVLPPVYSDHLIGATIRRVELLYNTRNDTKINVMFYGGSSTFQGIDGKTLSEYFNTTKYRVINCAQNAYVSGPLMMEMYSHFMKPDDVMTFMPEYSPQLYSSCLELPSWIAIEAFYDVFRYIDLRDYTRVFSSFYDLQHGSENYVYLGKLLQVSEQTGLSYEKYSTDFDEYFTRAEDFEIEKVTLEAGTKEGEILELKPLVHNDINRIYHKHYEGKHTLYFACYAFWGEAFKNTDHAEYEQYLMDNLEFPYISDYRNHVFELKYMSDTYSHLTREGAEKHSHVLGQELYKQMTFDGYDYLINPSSK